MYSYLGDPKRRRGEAVLPRRNVSLHFGTRPLHVADQSADRRFRKIHFTPHWSQRAAIARSNWGLTYGPDLV